MSFHCPIKCYQAIAEELAAIISEPCRCVDVLATRSENTINLEIVYVRKDNSRKATWARSDSTNISSTSETWSVQRRRATTRPAPFSSSRTESSRWISLTERTVRSAWQLNWCSDSLKTRAKLP